MSISCITRPEGNAAVLLQADISQTWDTIHLLVVASCKPLPEERAANLRQKLFSLLADQERQSAETAAHAPDQIHAYNSLVVLSKIKEAPRDIREKINTCFVKAVQRHLAFTQQLPEESQTWETIAVRLVRTTQDIPLPEEERSGVERLAESLLKPLDERLGEPCRMGEEMVSRAQLSELPPESPSVWQRLKRRYFCCNTEVQEPLVPRLPAFKSKSSG